MVTCEVYHSGLVHAITIYYQILVTGVRIPQVLIVFEYVLNDFLVSLKIHVINKYDFV